MRIRESSIRCILAGLTTVCCFSSGKLAAQVVSEGTTPGEERVFLGQVFKDAGAMTFCWCPPGKFKIGSPPTEAGRFPSENQKDVELSGFWMAKFEVTQAQFDQLEAEIKKSEAEFIEKQIHDRLKRTIKHARRYENGALPDDTILHSEATLFCEKLTVVSRGLAAFPQVGWEFRLPTEAQWEYACRAGTTTAYSFGVEAQQLGPYGWYRNNSGNGTHRVGEKIGNAWGLCDMHGNVWEWCRDTYQDEYLGGLDPEAQEDSPFHVIRGGSWDSSAKYCRSAFRHRLGPGLRYYDLGFRVALVRSKLEELEKSEEPTEP